MSDSQDERRRALSHTIDEFLAGDSRQYEIIRGRVTRYVHHHPLHERIDADDIVSETLHILYENLKSGTFRGNSLTALSVYVYSIVRFRILKALNNRKRELTTAHVPDVPGPDEWLQHQSRDLVQKIFGALDPECSKLLNLKFLKGWLNQEIADEIGRTKNATSTAISRCLKKVAEFGFVRESL